MKVALLTVSDSAAEGKASDLSGPVLHKLVAEGGRTVVRADILPDDRQSISQWLRTMTDEHQVDLILTSGGTGLSPRDVTPEATFDVIDFEVPGIAEAIRTAGLLKTPRAMLSRGLAGVRKTSLIINLSGSPKAVGEQWAVIEPIIEHAVDTIQGRGFHPHSDAQRLPPVVQEPPVVRVEPMPQPDTPRVQTLVGQPLSELLGEKVYKELKEKAEELESSEPVEGE